MMSVMDRLDTSVAHPARRYNYWLGDKDHLAADRQSGDEIARFFPTIRTMAVEKSAAARARRRLPGRRGRHALVPRHRHRPADRRQHARGRPAGRPGMLVAVLHFIRSEENPRAIIDTLVDALPAGSLVVASHVTLEHLPPHEAEELIRTDGQVRPRSGLDLTALFTRPDLQPIAPVQSVSARFDTRSDEDRPAAEDVACNGLVARVVRVPRTEG
jgi:hypothetical protein